MAKSKVTPAAPKKRIRIHKTRPMDVPITDPAFFSKLGSRGGSATRDKHGPDYYAKIAVMAHQSRREKMAAAARATKAAMRAAEAELKRYGR